MSRITAPLSLALVLSIALLPTAFAAVGLAPTPGASAAEGDVTWSVEPLRTADGASRSIFEYAVDPGTQVLDSMVITNSGETSAEFLIYATDAINEFDTGAFSLLARDETPTDVGSWITTDKDKLTIEPGMQAVVPFSMLVPSDATPGDHVAGVVAAVLTKGDSDGSAVTLEQRVGARVYLRVSGLIEASVETSGVTSGFNASLNPFAPGNMTMRFDVRNTGNLRVDVNETIAITGPFGIPLGEYTPEPLSNLLPRQTVRITADIPAIAALFLAWSTITLVPGPLGSAGTVPDAAAEPTSDAPVTPAPAEPATEVTPTADPAAAAPAATPAAPDPVAAAAALPEDQATVDYVNASSTSFTLAISWTLLALVMFVLLLIYFIVRYVSSTRDRMYLAIDEAAEAARIEAAAPAGELVGR